MSIAGTSLGPYEIPEGEGEGHLHSPPGDECGRESSPMTAPIGIAIAELR